MYGKNVCFTEIGFMIPESFVLFFSEALGVVFLSFGAWRQAWKFMDFQYGGCRIQSQVGGDGKARSIFWALKRYKQ